MALFGGAPEAPPPPPPPPPPPAAADPGIQQKGAAERTSLASAAGQGFSGTDVTGGQGVTGPTNTTGKAGQKALLGE